MDLDEYKAAIDKVPKSCRIDFSGMCEPFANKHAADMIVYAADHPLALYTTLQGATKEDWEKVKDLNYEVVTIHLPDQDGSRTNTWSCCPSGTAAPILVTGQSTSVYASICVRASRSSPSCTTVPATWSADRT